MVAGLTARRISTAFGRRGLGRQFRAAALRGGFSRPLNFPQASFSAFSFSSSSSSQVMIQIHSPATRKVVTTKASH